VLAWSFEIGMPGVVGRSRHEQFTRGGSSRWVGGRFEWMEVLLA